ncbi:hypothetical protein [Sphingobacterium sp. DR205]|uniref:hypothetical protein n=1 Tax=Sphingobacterium sp. DR205 TaxID=2713573 RepID=UPI0013E42A09|nr:hypothetical protein [Sphingobacterium sp. DR205]QIH36755.1 hypothetical protein G6053_29600 [Sphingobacterium sp. DR205]
MKNRLLMLNTIFALMFGTLISCEANKYVLINGDRQIFLKNNSECKLEIKSHFIREAFLIFELSPKGCDLEISNVDEWIEKLTAANGLDSGAIKLSKKVDISNRKVLISNGQTLRFDLVKDSRTWNQGKMDFIFPKNTNILGSGKPFFRETRVLSLEVGKMRFIF